jgi:hypothetical protein
MSGKVNTFFVKGLQTVCQPLARVVVVSVPDAHTSIVLEKSPFVSGINVPGRLDMLVGRKGMLVSYLQPTTTHGCFVS